MLIHRAIVAIGLCLFVTGGMAAVTTAHHATYALRPCSKCKEIRYETEQECRDAAYAEAERVGLTRETGAAVYTCITRYNVIGTFSPNATCGAKPADEQRQQTCPAGTVGTWLQDKVWTLQPYPDCWVQGDWMPTEPPEGMCAPVTPPEPPPASSTAYINAGGPAVSNYEADTHYVGGITSSNCQRAYSGIFPTRRYSPDSFEYRIPVVSGIYTVRLLTRECWNDATGLRVQRASIEGVAVPAYDTYTTANGGVISTERTVAVDDGTLDIIVTAVTGDAILNGIDVVPAGDSPPEEPLPPATGTATLNWVPPTANTDGKALTNLAGYRIAYGASPSELVYPVDVPNPGTTRYTMEKLAPGVYFFAVRAYTSDGTESELSNVVQKEIP